MHRYRSKGTLVWERARTARVHRELRALKAHGIETRLSRLDIVDRSRTTWRRTARRFLSADVDDRDMPLRRRDGVSERNEGQIQLQ